MLEPACLMGAWCLGLCAFLCPLLCSKQGSLQFSAVLLQMFCTCPVSGTFFKGTVVQKAQELHFLWQFSGTAQCVTFLVMFHIDLSLHLVQAALSPHHSFCSVCQKCICPHALTVPFVLPPFCPCCSVGRAGAACLCMVFSGYFY